MLLTKDFPAPAVNASPAGDNRPVVAQVGETGYQGTTYYHDVHLSTSSRDAFDPRVGTDVGAAIQAASDLTSHEFDANRSGHMWWKKDPAVEALAVVDTRDGLRLLRTDAEVDGYDYREGVLAQKWAHSPDQTLGKQVDPTVLALVSHDHLFDFRNSDGNVVKVKG